MASWLALGVVAVRPTAAAAAIATAILTTTSAAATWPIRGANDLLNLAFIKLPLLSLQWTTRYGSSRTKD